MGAGGSKTLVWGFAMAPHRMRILVMFFLLFDTNTITGMVQFSYEGHRL